VAGAVAASLGAAAIAGCARVNRQHPVRAVLRAAGAGRALLRARYLWRLAADPGFWQIELEMLEDYLRWRWRYGDVLRPRLYPAGATRRALIVAKGTLNGAQIELPLIKGLELAGFVPVVLTNRSDLEKHYRLAGVESFVRWDTYYEPSPVEKATALVDSATSLDDLVAIEHGGARVGKFAVSTTFRSLRVGRLDRSRPETRERLIRHIAAGLQRAAGAVRILDGVKPDLALFLGNRYTGHGELMDVCLQRGVDVLTWFDAHRSSSLMLKRYGMTNRDRHHGSIADDTWRQLRAMPWGERERAALRRELDDSYAAGDWYSRGGTQVNKSILPADALRARFGLDPSKKTAVIFPHVVWDATLFWGTDLFANYEDWLVATVQAACRNDRVNWIVKVHPVHVQKRALEGYLEESSEMTVIEKRVGPLPPHVRLIPPDTDINTFSLFPLMDYCLTVRGTVGIEAARLGVRVLTAGTGRYDHRGFTVDSETRDEYLARLAAIETIAPMTPHERELAERFAYGAFVMRPLPLSALTIEHGRDRKATVSVRINAASSDQLRSSPDLTAFAAWAADRTREDFLWQGHGGH
jgi:hypothetical protein